VSAPEFLSPIRHCFAAGRDGAPGRDAVTLSLPRRAIWQLMAAKGENASAGVAVEAAFGIALPGPNRASSSGAVTSLAIQPDQWLITAPLEQSADLCAKVAIVASDVAALVDQSGGKAILRISGARARDVLAKGCRIDLDPRVFGADAVAATPIAHLQMLIHRVGASDTYDLYVTSTFAEAAFDWLTTSAKQFGYEIA
jgi:heterotetrameric sarcosine oxidase gamma subunit